MVEFSLLNTGLKTLATLLLVIGFLILVLYLMRRFLYMKRGGRGDRMISVVSSLHLSPKERIQVLEIAGERIVLGLTPGRIEFLTKLDNRPESYAKLIANGNAHERPSADAGEK